MAAQRNTGAEGDAHLPAATATLSDAADEKLLLVIIVVTASGARLELVERPKLGRLRHQIGKKTSVRIIWASKSCAAQKHGHGRVATSPLHCSAC